jgi:dienelactone hydrolase
MLLASMSFGQEAAIDSTLNEQIVMVPASSGASGVELETTVFKPPGTGPFPVVIMNHGKARGNPHLQKRDRFIFLSREFVRRGYAVVIPMRTGFSKSTGEYSDYGCDMTSNGQLQANDLQSTLEYVLRQNWSDKNRVLIAGQSYGGLAAMAFSTRNFPAVRGVLNFAGGLRADGGSCQWQSALVQAFTAYGARSTIPSLWFYGENDSYFNHELASRMYSAYVAGGGNAQLVAYGRFKTDAHLLVGSRDGVKIWWPETEKFLQKIGMPTAPLFALVDKPAIPKSDYAAIDDIEAIPFIHDQGRNAYRTFLSKSSPRAFAVSATGGWSWAEDGDDPVERVLANCQNSSRQPCRLYAVDNEVVWTGDAVAPGTTTLSSLK